MRSQYNTVLPKRTVWSTSRLVAVRVTATVGALMAFGCVAWAIDEEIGETQAIARLQEGGNVVYLRHANRLPGPKESLSIASSAAEFADCRWQRNLSPLGQEEARELGESWEELGIPVGQVIASAQCRTRDTALIAFGHADLDKRLFDLDFVRTLLQQAPAAHTNTIVVGSDFQLRELMGVELAFTEAAIIRPNGRDGISVVARLDLQDWEEALDGDWW